MVGLDIVHENKALYTFVTLRYWVHNYHEDRYICTVSMPLLPVVLTSSNLNESEYMYLNALPEYSLEVFFKVAAGLVSSPERGSTSVSSPEELEDQFWLNAEKKIQDYKKNFLLMKNDRQFQEFIKRTPKYLPIQKKSNQKKTWR